MLRLDQGRNFDRLKATLGMALFHALLGYGLLYGLGFNPTESVTESLKVFNVRPDPPPPPPMESVPAEVRIEKPEGAAAPPSLPSTPVVAPKPKIVIDVPPPIAAAPKAGAGSSTTPGTAEVAGTGTGSGGTGNGTGSGGFGNGTGGGGLALRARRLSGGIRNSDYPKTARRERPSGTVYVRIAVAADGRVSGCAVTKSSGHTILDTITCRLIQQRFRYSPARDASGRPIAGVELTNFTWTFVPHYEPRAVIPSPSGA